MKKKKKKGRTPCRTFLNPLLRKYLLVLVKTRDMLNKPAAKTKKANKEAGRPNIEGLS